MSVLHLRSGDKTLSTMPAHREVIGIVDRHAYLKITPGDNIKVGDMTASDILHPYLTFDKWRRISVADDAYSVADIMQAHS